MSFSYVLLFDLAAFIFLLGILQETEYMILSINCLASETDLVFFLVGEIPLTVINVIKIMVPALCTSGKTRTEADICQHLGMTKAQTVSAEKNDID